MKYFVKNIYTDNEVSKRIREYGITKLARKLGLSKTYISFLVNNKSVCSKKIYDRIVKLILDAKNE